MLKTLSDALSERGYDTLTPVQEAVTDPALQEADLLVSAQTGSGKTVGFGLAIGPTLMDADETLGPAGTPLALIVAPTRELAFQVTRELEWLYAKAGARVTSCVGGMDMRDERRALERGAHIVVGTPGRLRDHIERGSLDLSELRAVVLDEADEMLDLGFREDLEFMLGEAPETRRTLLFSATVPPSIAALAKDYQRDAVRVTTLAEKGQHADIAYHALRVAPQDAETAIVNLLRFHEAQNAIVFANTRATVNRLAARFANRGFAVVTLSGELSQTERTHALQAMRDGRARVCVATDVAARGIDLPNLELVIHAELPSNSEGLLHRSGRTGRAGRKGISALVVPPKVRKRAERLLQSARITAEWMTAPSAEEILRRDEERLLADPAWSEEVGESDAAFAARLLAERTPEQIAAAYLRLYRQKHSAPEELSDPDTRAPEKERAPFGPSAWIALSVGRGDRAEPRWLLPLLCRAGGLDKAAIGAIRVQESETFVELSEPVVAGFLSSLGEGGVLEEGVSVRAVEGTPEFASSGPRPGGPDRRPRKDAPGGKRDDRKAPRSEAKPRSKPADADAPGSELAGRAPKPDERPQRTERRDTEARGPRPDRDARPRGDDRAERSGPAGGKRVDRDGDARPPRKDRPEGGPGAKRRDWSDKPRRDDRADAPKPGPKGGKRDFADRKAGPKPGGKGKFGKPDFGDTPRGGKGGPARKGPETGGDERPRWAKPGTGPRGGAGGAKGQGERRDASDTSKRFTPPKRAQGAGPARSPGARDGSQPPRRGKKT
ncbi:DEAD/DEAH box helicase [Roseivivax marinus]|uniref:DEAD/DEAH box helicase n=1 Tax=Roseivivax marinus TaxID=1379903 RepID=UPI00273E7AF1|nr:DEAD/DEAH box helicase [Roseivivax marinus]